MDPRLLRTLPPNFNEFIGEIAHGLRALYGQAGEAEYRNTAHGRFLATIEHPSVDVWGAFDGERAAAILIALERQQVGHIVFTHVLQPYQGQGIERTLIEHSVRALRTRAIDGIISECVPFCELDPAPAYAQLDFTPVQRAIMISDLAAATLQHAQTEQSNPLEPNDYPEAAEVLVQAYADSPGHTLHAEVRSKQSALDFITSAVDGGFGTTRPEYCRALRVDGRLAGIVCGVEAAPDVGFILQLAVQPAARGCGHGAALLAGIAEAFECAGMTRMALGVTLDNPARRLYERQGFALDRQITAYTWWKPETPSGPALA